jgi:hypothetical protein
LSAQFLLLHHSDEGNIYFESADSPSVTFLMRQCATCCCSTTRSPLTVQGKCHPDSFCSCSSRHFFRSIAAR